MYIIRLSYYIFKCTNKIWHTRLFPAWMSEMGARESEKERDRRLPHCFVGSFTVITTIPSRKIAAAAVVDIFCHFMCLLVIPVWDCDNNAYTYIICIKLHTFVFIIHKARNGEQWQNRWGKYKKFLLFNLQSCKGKNELILILHRDYFHSLSHTPQCECVGMSLQSVEFWVEDNNVSELFCISCMTAFNISWEWEENEWNA